MRPGVNSLDFNDESRHEQLQNLNQKLLFELILNSSPTLETLKH